MGIVALYVRTSCMGITAMHVRTSCMGITTIRELRAMTCIRANLTTKTGAIFLN